MRSIHVAALCGLVVAAAIGAPACGGDDESATTPTEARDTVAATTASEPSAPPRATTTTTTPEPTTSTAPPTSPPTAPSTTFAASTSAPVASTTEPVLVDVKVYLLRGERLAIAHRSVPAPAVLRGALIELLAGPTAGEGDVGLHSQIPTGTMLRDVALADGLVTVDLDRRFESGGGSLSMMARIAQIVFTATQFDNADRVLFRLDGAPVDYLGGEGIVLDTPQRRLDVDRAFTGGILVDTPAPGDQVTSPFRVTGEGDVFEGEFPLEVRRDGIAIAPPIAVRAGAWGEWAEFEATVELDVPTGAIELVARDEGGCGTEPECPPVVEVVVPLTLVR